MITVGSFVQIKAQYATAKFKGAYEVLAVPGGNRKTYKLRSAATGQEVKAYSQHIEPLTVPLEEAMAQSMPTPGTVVAYRHSHYVVTGASKYGARLALLGGNGQQYTNVPVKSFDVVPVDALVKTLANL
jgi:hypothetical protein